MLHPRGTGTSKCGGKQLFRRCGLKLSSRKTSLPCAEGCSHHRLSQKTNKDLSAGWQTERWRWKDKSPSSPSTISLTLVKYPPQWIESKSITKFKNTFNADLFISRSVCTMDSFPLQKLFQKHACFSFSCILTFKKYSVFVTKVHVA